MVRFRALLLGLLLLGGGQAWALYDPKPVEALDAVQGRWQGTLSYRDYSRPDRMVSLPTTLFIALAAPDELVLHYRFADGPGKTVYSYERMKFDFTARQVSWVSGSADRSETVAQITADTQAGPLRRIVFEHEAKGQTQRYTLELAAESLSLQKEELTAGAPALLRNRFSFQRAGN